jgi:hypothetical protein
MEEVGTVCGEGRSRKERRRGEEGKEKKGKEKKKEKMGEWKESGTREG